MTNEIKKAFDHVRAHHPATTLVVFNKYGQWRYMNDNFVPPVFGDEIDSGILENAADSVESFPAVFHI